MPHKVLLVCELCRTAGKPDFKTPVDKIGAALMEQHLRTDHHLTSELDEPAGDHDGA